MSIREMKVDDLKRIVELEKDLFLSPWNEEDFIQEKPLLTAQIIVAAVAVIFIIIVMS